MGVERTKDFPCSFFDYPTRDSPERVGFRKKKQSITTETNSHALSLLLQHLLVVAAQRRGRATVARSEAELFEHDLRQQRATDQQKCHQKKSEASLAPAVKTHDVNMGVQGSILVPRARFSSVLFSRGLVLVLPLLRADAVVCCSCCGIPPSCLPRERSTSAVSTFCFSGKGGKVTRGSSVVSSYRVEGTQHPSQQSGADGQPSNTKISRFGSAVPSPPTNTITVQPRLQQQRPPQATVQEGQTISSLYTCTINTTERTTLSRCTTLSSGNRSCSTPH